MRRIATILYFLPSIDVIGQWPGRLSVRWDGWKVWGQRQLTAAQQSRVMPQQTEQSNGVLLLRTLGGCANGLCWPSFAQLDDQQCLVPSGHLVS